MAGRRLSLGVRGARAGCHNSREEPFAVSFELVVLSCNTAMTRRRSFATMKTPWLPLPRGDGNVVPFAAADVCDQSTLICTLDYA